MGLLLIWTWPINCDFLFMEHPMVGSIDFWGGILGVEK